MQSAVTRHGFPTDDVFDALAVTRRRAILTVLREHSAGIDVQTLARAVSSHEQETARESVSDSTVEQVHVTLHHVHLPKLDALDLVTYDHEERTVEPTDVIDTIPVEFA